MPGIDLHLHTTFSDGLLAPKAVVAEAAAAGLTLIAITDHDEVAGVAPAQEAARQYGIAVLAGVEINTDVGREDVHILGYGIAPDSAVLLAGLAVQRRNRVARAERMVARLATIGYPVELARVLALAGHGSVGRPHVARALVEAGHMENVAEAFTRLLGDGRPAFCPRVSITPEEAIALLHVAGGFASLAHPGKLGDPLRFIRRLKAAGLDALEAYHSDHTAAVTARMVRWARAHELGITGGSDSHGPESSRPIRLGALDVPEWVGEEVQGMIRKVCATVVRSAPTVPRAPQPP